MRKLASAAPAGGATMQLSFDFAAPAAALDSATDERQPLSPVPQAVGFFLGLVPDPAVAARMAQLAGELRGSLGLSGPPRPTRVLHLTLQGIERASLVAAVARVGALVKAPPFTVTFDRVMSFDRTAAPARPLVLCCGDGLAELTDLRRTLATEMKLQGLSLREEAASFVPHVTLLYDRRSVPETLLERPIVWTVREFVLVRSLRGRTQHDYLARWPLRS